MIDLGSIDINSVGELVLLIIVTIWLWLSVIYLGSFIFCIISFIKQINKNNIDLENIPNHEKIREIVEANREKKRDRNLLNSSERNFLNENWEEISARIGKKNLKYMKRFYGEKRKFNWGSGFFCQSWLFYRGMLKEYFLVIIVIIFLYGILFSFWVNVMSIIVLLLFGMFGDYYYFKSLQKRIIKKKGEITRFKIYFIVINLLFPPMILLSWFMFLFRGGY